MALPERTRGRDTAGLEPVGGRRQAELRVMEGTSEAGRGPKSKRRGHVLRFC